jgi:hypothetical protein
MSEQLSERLDVLEQRLAAVESKLGASAIEDQPESRIAWQHGRRPDFWSDVEVRRHIITRHRHCTLSELRAEVRALFGDARTPSRSAIARLWKRLDITSQRRRAA